MPNSLVERRSSHELSLRRLLEEAVAKRKNPGIIFSGGLDTSILAFLARAQNPGVLIGMTVCVSKNAPDSPFATSLARRLGMKHHLIEISLKDLALYFPALIRILKTYDPMELRNSVVVYAALQKAKALGLREVITGDGADELFAGYSFLTCKPPAELKKSLTRMWHGMYFSAPVIGNALKICVSSPYLDASIRELAAQLEHEEFVTQRNGEIFGKTILRQAFDGELPPEYLWRRKDPIEVGSGSAEFPQFFDETTSDADWDRKKKEYCDGDGVKLRSKEHMALYEIYRGLFGPPVPARSGERACPDCQTPVVPFSSDFCRLCGAWPVP